MNAPLPTSQALRCFSAIFLLQLFLASPAAHGADARTPPRRFKIPRAVVPGFLEPRQDPATVAIGERLFLVCQHRS